MRFTKISRAVIVKGSLRLFIAAISIVAISCSKTSLTSTDILTSSSWKINTVSVDGVDKTSVYLNMTLAFTSSTYKATNGAPVWPASGTWAFTDATGKTFIRNDGLIVTVEKLESNSLELSLFWPSSTYGPGRVQSISGQNTFTFTR